MKRIAALLQRYKLLIVSYVATWMTLVWLYVFIQLVLHDSIYIIEPSLPVLLIELLACAVAAAACICILYKAVLDATERGNS